MKKGFTLVELLAVIVILAVILAIAVPGISSVLNNVKVNAYKSQMSMIENAAKKYMMDGFKYEDMKIGETRTVTLQQLYDNKLLSNVKNPTTNTSLDPTTVVYVTKKNDNNITYTYSEESDCRYNGYTCLEDNITSDLVGKSQSYQGGTYYKGTNATILNNYVWYSGQEYRVMGINSDGSIKMVTSLPVVSISWGPSGAADYANNSYARKWLNILPTGHALKDDYEGVFYKSLNRPDLIQNYAFCIGKQDPTSGTDTTCSSTLTDKVGLMTWWEYKIAGASGNGTDSYLTMTDFQTFLTGDATNTSNILISWYTDGSISGTSGATYTYALSHSYTIGDIRPVINLKPTVSISSGNGTSSNPYTLIGAEAGNKDDNIGSRYAGEYLNFKGVKYRIVSKDSNGNTKIVTDNYVTSTGTTSGAAFTYWDLGADASNVCQTTSPYTNCDNHFNIADGSGDYNGSAGHNIGYFLDSNASNSFWTTLTSTYQAYLTSSIYYLGKWDYGTDYKQSYTNAVSNGYGTQDLKVGMLMHGEMLAGNNCGSSPNNMHYWLINPYNSSVTAAAVNTYGYVTNNFPSSAGFAVRPVLNLKSTIKIVSGNGTKSVPYEITN